MNRTPINIFGILNTLEINLFTLSKIKILGGSKTFMEFSQD
jgi:hypothetical protein